MSYTSAHRYISLWQWTLVLYFCLSSRLWYSLLQQNVQQLYSIFALVSSSDLLFHVVYHCFRCILRYEMWFSLSVSVSPSVTVMFIQLSQYQLQYPPAEEKQLPINVISDASSKTRTKLNTPEVFFATTSSWAVCTISYWICLKYQWDSEHLVLIEDMTLILHCREANGRLNPLF